jgi:hypothetical protein
MPKINLDNYARESLFTVAGITIIGVAAAIATGIQQDKNRPVNIFDTTTSEPDPFDRLRFK